MAIVASRGSDQFPVRLPEGMRDKIKSEAEKNGRSMNSEVVARLEASFDDHGQLSSDISRVLEDYVDRRVAARLAEIAKQIGGR